MLNATFYDSLVNSAQHMRTTHIRQDAGATIIQCDTVCCAQNVHNVLTLCETEPESLDVSC
jgi:hypothetical protein